MTEQNHPSAHEDTGAPTAPTYPHDTPEPGYSNALAVPSPIPPPGKADEAHGTPAHVSTPAAPHAPAAHKR